MNAPVPHSAPTLDRVTFEVLKNAGVRRLPVLEENDLAGIITVDDLLVWLVLEFGAVVSPAAHEVVHHGSR